MSSLPDQLPPEARREDVTSARIEQLYASHASLVRSVCRSLLRDRVEADDAVQQTFLSAQRALLNGSSPRDEAAWLATIARHESLARVRARMRDPLPVDIEAEAFGSDAYSAAVKRHEAGELRNALAELPAQQRDAILMREVRGFSYEEVASALSVTPAAVESLLFRARRGLQLRLREALASFSPGFAFRDLLSRAGGVVAGPAGAKAVAVGVGAAVITGGAFVGPRLMGPHPAPSTHRAGKSASGDARSRVSVTSTRHSRLIAAPLAAVPKPRPTRTQSGRHDSASSGSGSSSSDGRGDSASSGDGHDSGSGSHEGSGSDGGKTGATSSGSGDTSTTADGGGSGSQSKDGGTQTTSSGSGGTSTTSDGGGSGSGDGSSGGGDGQPPSYGSDG